LALVKRYVELTDTTGIESGKPLANGRGYFAEHLKLVAWLGTGSGWLAALVLAIYVHQSEQVVLLYQHPLLLLLACPLLLFWISRVWWLARRGEMHDDPVVFALKDWASYLVGTLTLLVMWLAAKQNAALKKNLEPFIRHSRYLAAIGTGLLLALAFPKFSFAGFAWIVPALMFAAAHGKSGGERFRLGYISGLAFWLATLYWLLLIPVTGFPI